MNGRIWLTTIALATALGATPPVQAGKLYKWVDEQGNISYSQHKPPDRESETIRLRSATLESSGTHSLGSSHLSTGAQELIERAGDQQDDRESGEDSATAERDERMAKNCETARENIRILRTNSRVQDTNAKGEPYFLDEAGKQAKMVATQQQIDSNCN